MSRNLIIFDIDGTVADSQVQHETALFYAYKEMGCHNINDDWNSYDHVTDNYIFRKIFKENHNRDANLNDQNTFQDLMVEKMNELGKIKEIPGAKSFIQKVWDNEQWDLAFATGSLLETALIKLNGPEIKYKPSIVISSNEIKTREELLISAELAAKRLFQINNYNNILSCGDALWDVKTAKNVGLPFLGVGMTNKEKLKQAGVVNHIDDWTNLNIDDLDSFFS